MTTGFRVIRPGMHTLLQDMGRYGHYRQGLTLAGPVDRLSFMWANRLCGNRSNTTALELTFGGLEIEATIDTVAAVTGADATVTLNNHTVTNWRNFNLKAGDRLVIGHPRQGIRNYLAVSGGFSIPTVFGSTATAVRENIGGINGKAIKKDDLLPISHRTSVDLFYYLPEPLRPETSAHYPFRVIPCWQYADFSKETKRRFLSNVYVISPMSNRMGYRLQGKRLTSPSNNMLSEGIIPGSIQVPPNGLPIIMHYDHQTIGGYPKIGTMLSLDLWRLAQLAPGTAIHFKAIRPSQGISLVKTALREFEQTIPHEIKGKAQPPGCT